MTEKQNEFSPEFQEKSELIKQEEKFWIKKHQMKMEELAYIRATEKMKHDWELERGRIKSAEIRKFELLKQEGERCKRRY